MNSLAQSNVIPLAPPATKVQANKPPLLDVMLLQSGDPMDETDAASGILILFALLAVAAVAIAWWI